MSCDPETRPAPVLPSGNRFLDMRKIYVLFALNSRWRLQQDLRQGKFIYNLFMTQFFRSSNVWVSGVKLSSFPAQPWSFTSQHCSNSSQRKKLSERRPTPVCRVWQVHARDISRKLKENGAKNGSARARLFFLRSWAKIWVQFQKSLSTTLHNWAGKLQSLTSETQTFDVTWKHVLHWCVHG